MSNVVNPENSLTVNLACEERAVIPGRSVLWSNTKVVLAFALWFSLLLLAIGVIFKTLPFTMSGGGIALLMVTGTIALYIWNRTSKSARAVRRLRYDGEILLTRLGVAFTPLLLEEFEEHERLQKLIDSKSVLPVKDTPRGASKHFWRARINMTKLLKRHAPAVLDLLREEAKTLLHDDHDIAIYRLGVNDAGEHFVKRVHTCSIPCEELGLHRKSYAEAKKNWEW